MIRRMAAACVDSLEDVSLEQTNESLGATKLKFESRLYETDKFNVKVWPTVTRFAESISCVFCEKRTRGNHKIMNGIHFMPCF